MNKASSSLAILGLCGALATTGSEAKELWRGLEAGASLATVNKTFPGMAYADTSNGYEHYTGPIVPVAGRSADVTLTFHDRGLSGIHLAIQQDANPEINRQTAAEVEGLLSQKYGKPYNCSDSPAIDARECHWKSGGIKIDFSRFGSSANGWVWVEYSTDAGSLDANL